MLTAELKASGGRAVFGGCPFVGPFKPQMPPKGPPKGHPVSYFLRNVNLPPSFSMGLSSQDYSSQLSLKKAAIFLEIK